ncbi:MAG: PH domain-containing protein [Clostridium sp.]
MFKEPTRNHWTFLFGRISKLISEMFFLIIVAFFNINEGGIFVILALLVLSVIVSILSWLTIKFYIDGDELVYKKGIIFKKKIEVPFNKINTVDIRKTIIDKIFKVCTVKIDSGATEDGQEIKINISSLDAIELKRIILSSKSEEIEGLEGEEVPEVKEREEIIKRTITFKELALYAVTKGKLLWAIGAFFVVTQFVQQIDEILETKMIDDALNSIDVDFIFTQNLTNILLGIVVMFIFSYILISLIFLVVETLRLYNFTLSSDGKNIKISYGALTTKEYSIPIEKIHALRYKQGMLQQLIGVYNLEAVTIGYGDEQNEKAILYPIANKKFMDETISLLLPELVGVKVISKPPKRALSRFIIKRNLIPLTVIAPIFMIVWHDYMLKKIIIVGVVILINSFLGYINYKNTSLGFDEKTIVGSSGSILKMTTIIKQSSVQSIETKQGPFHRRKKVFDMKIDIYTNNFGEVVTIKNMDDSLEEPLRNSLIF